VVRGTIANVFLNMEPSETYFPLIIVLV